MVQKHLLSVALVTALLVAGCDGGLSRAPAPASTPVVADIVELAAPPADWAALDGRVVRITAPLTVGGHHELDRRGELITSFGGRMPVPTEVAPAGPEAQAIAADNTRRRLLLDDASDAEHPGRAWYLPAGIEALRSGSVVTRAEGRVELRDGQPRLQLTAPLMMEAAPRPAPPVVGGDVRIAALNLENLFNGDGRGGGFPTPRGARTFEEYGRQQARLVATLRGLDADVVALMELENDGHGRDSSVAQLVAEMNAGGGQWRAVDARRGPGGDAIRVGIAYRADRVRAVGQPATLVEGPFGDGSRVPLAQAFRAGNGPAFVVVANHFKSKGCGDAAGADADQRDGQACWNALRTDSAQRLDRWLKTDPTRSRGDLAVILGDFNAHRMETPIRTLVDAGWRDAFAAEPGTYSYVFRGEAGRLDHALLTPMLAERLVGAAKWHTNADEPASAGYRESPAGTGPWRSSDHDPLVLGLRLRTP